jgi:hypothetical protein
MASSHDQHDGAATAGHEDPQTYAHADADADGDEHDGHGHDGHGQDAHDDGHDDDHGHDSHEDGHGEETSGWVLIPLGVGAAIAIVLILVFGIRSDAPERTEPIGATRSDVAGEHGSTADDEQQAEDAEDSADEESTPTTHE